jgi:hypothetical protein
MKENIEQKFLKNEKINGNLGKSLKLNSNFHSK